MTTHEVPVPLREHLEALLAEKDRRDVQRFEAQSKALDAAFLAQTTAMQAALASAEKAVTTALLAADTAVRAALEAANESVGAVRSSSDARYAETSAALRMLAEHIPRFTQLGEQIQALDRLTDAKFTTLRTVVDSEAEKVALALKAADKAALLLAEATEKRFESVNEFRGTLTDQAAGFTTRIEFQTARDVLSERVSELTANTVTHISRGEFAALAARVDKQEGRGQGLNAGWVYLLGGLGALGTIVSLIVVVLAFAP